MRKRLLSWLLVLTMMASLIPGTLVTALAAYTLPGSYTGEYDVAQLGTFTNGGTYRLHGTGTSPVVIPAGASVTIVLDQVTIESETSPIQVQAGAALRLVPKAGTTNTLKCTSDTAEAVTTNSASGLTAGISVPEKATLTIDNDTAGDGTLNITGGYGGAGIGGSYVGTESATQSGAKGGDSAAGTTGNAAGTSGRFPGGAAGAARTGGAGGAYGNDGTAAGNITINGGTITVTGGNGGAGIGGGRGTDGAVGQDGVAGEQGKQGTSGIDGNRSYKGGGGGSSGGSAGGNGGNGGAGGAGGTVAISGGTVTATGGTSAAAIGGGAGGTGGNGGAGGAGGAECAAVNVKYYNWGDFFANAQGGGAGGNGDGGKAGRGGAGGNAGTLTITGGNVNAIGHSGFGGGSVGADGANGSGTYSAGQAGPTRPRSGQGSNYDHSWKGMSYISSQQTGWVDYCAPNTIRAYICVGKAVSGGNGGQAAAQAAANADGAAGTLNITGSSNNVDFKNTNGATSTNNRPVDKNDALLYKTVITVKNLENTETLPNATISIPVGSDSSSYNYETITDSLGQGIVWLPEGTYVLSGQMVNSPANGSMTEDKTLTVQANDNNAITVNVGIDLVLKPENSGKVYLTDDVQTPLNLVVDVSKIDGSIQSIRWFREEITGNTQQYGTGSVLFKTYNEGYEKAADANKSEVTVNAGDKTIKIPVGQNGRYWFEIAVQLTDKNGGNPTSVTLIKLLTVDNIYTQYNIQVRTKEMKRDGSEKYTGAYESLKTALGTNYTGNYGFAWDLDGETTKTLVPTPSAGYDTVQVNALNSKVKWYNAFFGTQNTTMNKNAAKTGFDPITLTLDQNFLTNNNDADKGANDQTDPTKYTITYTPEGIPVAEVTIRGVVLEDDGTEKQELWSYDNSYPEGVTEATINGFRQAGYRIDKVLINGEERNDVTLTGNSIHLTNLQGTEAKNYTDAITKVEFVYVDNMVDVTVKGIYNGSELEGGYTVRLEKDAEATVKAPSVTGYTADEPSKSYTPTGDGPYEVTFDFTKDKGNVTVLAVENGKEIYRKDGGTVNRGDKIDLTGDAKAPAIEYYTTTGTPKSVTVNGAAVTDLDTYTYTGVGDIIVTYEYTRKTQEVTIVKKDVATGKQIETEKLNLSVGESHTFTAAEVTVPAGYSEAADRNPTSYFVEDKADQTVTFWYKNTSDDQYTQVTVNLICGGEIFQTYPVTAVKGVVTTIKAPDCRGYVTPVDSIATITPDGDAEHDKVEFTYTINDPKTVKVVLKDNSNKADPDAELTAPNGYTKSYTLKDGDSIEIWAPTLEGYALRGATLNDAEQQNMQSVTVSYDALKTTNTVVFRYLPVAQANFVIHTIKFMLGTQELYSYEKMVPKGTGSQVSYPADAVADMVPGYIYDTTEYQKGGVSVRADEVTDDANAVIIYRFKEDTAQITIKFKDENGDPLKSGGAAVADQVLTGYRKGQTIEVPAPVLNGFALAPSEDLIKTVALSATDANTEVDFKYVPLADTYFILKEKLADGTDKIITFINAKENTKYDTRYIIEGWHYRLLILDLYLVFVENVSLARRLSAAKSQKDFLRLQKQADRYQKRAYKKMRKWGIPKDCESFAIDTLQKALEKKYLTQLPDDTEETEI